MQLFLIESCVKTISSGLHLEEKCCSGRTVIHDKNHKLIRIVITRSAQFSLKGISLPRIHFQQQLAELKDKLLAMAALAQQAVESAADAYLQRDAGLCQYVRENETAINSAQREVDEMAYELLAKEQPMAIDLRFILAVIKINGDLERIGDQSMSIAIRTQDLLEHAEVDLPVDIGGMAEYATRMIRSAIQALLDADAR